MPKHIPSVRSTCGSLLVASIVLAAPTRPLGAQASENLTTPGATARAGGTLSKRPTVLISSSGGIAKGSYQAGVDWAIVEFLRRLRIPEQHAILGADSTVRKLKLGAVTGASAGNVNALFNALAWCTKSLRGTSGGNSHETIGAEESLYWRAWVNTGFSKLLPEKNRRGREPAVLDRRFFEIEQLKFVLDYLHRATPVACDMPLGITLTRQTAERVPMFNTSASISVQRFASVLRVRELNNTIDFQPDTVAAKSPSLGALALLPDLMDSAPSTRDIRLGKLFDVVVASSSFPGAFASKKICYQPGGLAPTPSTGTEPTCKMFSDGGLFDNNPFALVLRLHELSQVAQGDQRHPVSVAYTNPWLYRGSLKTERHSESKETDRTGIAAVVQLGRSAIPSAREYELQSLLRLSARDSELVKNGAVLQGADEPTLMLSSRSAPILGEQISSFGAFLGRTFREYDFYTGIYDGLEFIAHHFLCADSSGAALETCTTNEVDRLVSKNALRLDSLAYDVVRWQHAGERSALAPKPVAVPTFPKSSDDTAIARRVLVTAIHNAMLPLRKGEFEHHCSRRNDPIAGAICGTRFDNVLFSLSKDGNVRSAAEALRDWCEKKSNEKTEQRGECSSDDQFVALLESPRRALNALAERALRNLDDVENAIKDRKSGQKDYSAFTEAAISQYRSATFRYRRGIHGSGLEINPSTAVWDGRGVSRFLGSFLIGVLAPNYVSLVGGGKLAGDAGEPSGNRLNPSLGWRPLVFRPWEQLYLSVPAELSWVATMDSVGHRRTSVSAGLTIGTNVWTPKGFSSIDLGVLMGDNVLNQERERPNEYFPIASLSGRLFSERIQVTTRWSPELGWSASFGLADVNGLLYWWNR